MISEYGADTVAGLHMVKPYVYVLCQLCMLKFMNWILLNSVVRTYFYETLIGPVIYIFRRLPN